MAVKAQAKYVRVAPRKVREVVDLIRGKSVAEARSTLFFANRNAARIVAKVLNSAVANAENNNALSADDLYVKEARVDEGPTLKRWKFRAMGRVNRIRKRSSHITIAVEQKGGPFLVGQKVHPGGFRVGDHPRLEVALVHREGIQAVPGRGRAASASTSCASSPTPVCRASSSARTRTT